MLLDEKKPDSFFSKEDDLEDLSLYSSGDKMISDNLEPLEQTNPKLPEEEPKEPTILQELFSYIKILCIAIVLALFINHFVIVNASVPTGSMNNTIMEGDRLIGFRLAYTFSQPKRGDIIIFKYPDDPTQKFVKRVIGLPGDVVKIANENGTVNVYVNDEKLNEPYLKEAMRINQDYLFIVPNNSYFVMGDNRNDSKDSRFWDNTYVRFDQIVGKAIVRYYPSIKLLK